MGLQQDEQRTGCRLVPWAGGQKSAGQFTVELPQGWQTVETPVQFPVCKGRTPAWAQYMQSRRLEVTCGEAPFLAQAVLDTLLKR